MVQTTELMFYEFVYAGRRGLPAAIALVASVAALAASIGLAALRL